MDKAIILGYVSIFASCLAALLAIFIAYRQHKISKKTLEIGLDTKSITEQFETDRSLREKSSRLFPSLGAETTKEDNRYTVVYPVKYQDKPLPMINQGDFFAINSISVALGVDNVDLLEVQDDGTDVDQVDVSGNTIFICSPQANPALSNVKPYAVLDKLGVQGNLEVNPGNLDNNHICTTDDDVKKWLKEIGLPCWFITEPISANLQEIDSDNVNNDTPASDHRHGIKKIQVYDKDDLDEILDAPIISPADKCYQDSFMHAKKMQYGKVDDYGIFARITENDKVYVILAGIHQYGTWIVAEFLNGLLRRGAKKSEVKAIFESTGDFVSIIRGSFVSKTLTVDWCDIDGRNLWVKTSDGTWIRYDRVTTAPEEHITSALRRTGRSLRL